MHVQGGGTSAASPVVAGLAGLYLQMNPTATSGTVKNAVDQCAYADGFTGTLPNPLWGYGKLDGKAAMLCVITGQKEIVVNDNHVKYYPNPFSNHLTIELDKVVNGTISIYSPEGKLLLQDAISSRKYELNSTSLNENYKGILFVRIISDNQSFAFKLVRTN
jgi:subtilisin family serine protease